MAKPEKHPAAATPGDLRPQTVAVVAGRTREVGQPLNTPIHLASSFQSGLVTDHDGQTVPGVEYSRNDGTQTWLAFEQAIGELEGGTALSFASGMAAISSIFAGLSPGSVVVIPKDCYQGVAMLVGDGEDRLGWSVIRLATSDTPAWLDAIPKADLVWLESPSNPMLEIADVPTICAAARAAGVVSAVDNTFATSLLQKPLDLGATFSVHSATKFIGGHSDLLSGVVISRDSQALEAIRMRRTLGGATPGALESFLALRGLRTLPLRLQRAQRNAGELASRLAQHRIVTAVHYPGLATHAGHDLAADTLGGPGAMLSFETLGSAVSTDVRISRLKLIQAATSLGGVETSIERRAKIKGQEHIPATLMRLSVGIEHVEDLWDDLDQALEGVVESR